MGVCEEKRRYKAISMKLRKNMRDADTVDTNEEEEENQRVMLQDDDNEAQLFLPQIEDNLEAVKKKY